MIKVIIFDFGGVYLSDSFIDFVNKAHKVLGVNKNFFSDKEVIFDVEFNKGEITIEECLKKYFKCKINKEQMKKIINLWTKNWKPSKEMKELVIKLEENYRLAVLSNSDALNSLNYTKRGWYKYFNVLILSHELGIVKPQKEIYEIAVKKLKVEPEECLFIDDQRDCLKPARKMGMATILFKSVSQLKKELQERNIKFL